MRGLIYDAKINIFSHYTKLFKNFISIFSIPTQHTLTVCPNQQQPSSNLQARKPTFSTPTHNVYSPGIAKRSSLSRISAQFNQPASFNKPINTKKRATPNRVALFYINNKISVIYNLYSVIYYSRTRSTYEPSRVSILILSPALMNKGTRTSAPFSTVAGFNVLVAVSPFKPGSV